MKNTISHIGEEALIAYLKKSLRKNTSVLTGIGDDCAVVRFDAKTVLLITADMLQENVHFTRASASSRQIGHKALGASLSDIAAMGGVPLWAVVSLGVAPKTPVSFIKGIYQGMQKLADRYNVSIVGGDTIRSTAMTINVSLIGKARTDHLTRRDGACVGDHIFVTGVLGGTRKKKHVTFIPRVQEAQCLVKTVKPTSMMDLSDGLAVDLERLALASNVGAHIDGSLVPIAPQARSLKRALTDGEDFELLFTVSPSRVPSLMKCVKKERMKCTRIGQIARRAEGVVFFDQRGCEIDISKIKYRHF